MLRRESGSNLDVGSSFPRETGPFRSSANLFPVPPSPRLLIGAPGEMVKTTTRREDDDAPQVQCDQCSRWAYLDETDFKTPREARASGVFVCSICSSSAVLAGKLEVVATEATELRGVVRQLQEQVSQLMAQLHSNVHSEGEAPSSKGGDPRHEPGTLPSPDSSSVSSHADPGAQRGKAEETEAPGILDVAGVHSTALKETKLDGAQPDIVILEQPDLAAHEDLDLPGLRGPTIGGRVTLSQTDADAVKHTGPGTPPAPKKQRQEELHSSQQSRTQRPHTGPGDKCVYPAQTVDREVIVVGDGNVGAIATSLQKAIDLPKAVGFIYRKGNSSVDLAVGSIGKYEQKARPIQRRYVVHSGLTEVLKGQPEHVVQKLVEGCRGRSVRLLVCSIPDINNQGEEVRAAVRLANVQLRKWCKRERHRFINLNEGWGATMWDKEGVRYSPQGVSFVAEKIGGAIQGFLGHRLRRGGKIVQAPQSPYARRTTRKHRQPPAQPQIGISQSDHFMNAPLQAASQWPQTFTSDTSRQAFASFPHRNGANVRPLPPLPTQLAAPPPQMWLPPPQPLGQPSGTGESAASTAPLGPQVQENTWDQRLPVLQPPVLGTPGTPVPPQVLLPWGPATAAPPPQFLHTPHQVQLLPAWGQAPPWNSHPALSSVVEELVRHHLMRAAHLPQ